MGADGDRAAFDAACAKLERRRAKLGAIPLEPARALRAPVDVPEIPEPDPGPCGCGGRGWLVDAKANTAAPCSCQRVTYSSPEAVPAAELIARGVPPKLAGESKDTWRGGRWPEELDSWPGIEVNGRRPRVLTLWGCTGTGKDHAATHLFRRALAKGVAAWFFDTPTAIQRSYEDLSLKPDVPWYATRVTRPFAVISDVGSHRADLEFQEDLIWQLVHTRDRLNLWTVYTTNLDPDGLTEWFPRAASRMRDGLVIEMDGQDYRVERWR